MTTGREELLSQVFHANNDILYSIFYLGFREEKPKLNYSYFQR